ncbi:MAG: chemotaxis protein CheW [Magnetococcus sp. YQC-3]
MQEQPNPQSTEGEYLVVSLTDTLYGLDARSVREVVRLPEITSLEDAPLFILGVINLRGRVVPVLDLNNRLGHPSLETHLLSDAVVVLEQGDLLLGLLVNEVREIVTLEAGDWESTPRFEPWVETAAGDQQPAAEVATRRYRFVQGVAKVGEDLVMLLALDHLLHVQPADWLGGGEAEGGPEAVEPLTIRRRFNPLGDATTQKIFHERAGRLRQPPDQQQLEERVSLAIVRLHGEMLGINLTGVTGFAKVHKVTPVPCCPGHIAGSMNLRGDVLTLVDLCRILDLPTSAPDQSMEKAVVLPMGNHVVGVLVHDVLDVIHLQPTEITGTPTAATALRREHLSGAMPYGKQMLGILNIQAILADPALVVNEEV